MSRLPLPAVLQNLRIPVIGAPMFIVSAPDLVIAQCKAGIVGSFPALNARPQEVLEEWIVRIKTELAAYKAANPDKIVAPFAVNQICHKTNLRLGADMAVCVKHEVPIIITSLRAPAEIVDAAHSYGGIVLHDVISIRHARKAVEEGADGLIAVCAGAGGHAGALSPFALVPEIRQWFEGPLALSGAIANGASILAAQALGADFGYIGTRFIATREANADARYKEAIVNSAAGDILYTNLFTGVLGNYLKASVISAGLDPDNLPQADPSRMNFGSGSAKAKAWRDIWGAGQGVGQIADVPSVEDVVARLAGEYAAARARLANTELLNP
jgi:nitronate monooxygenase